MKTALLDNSKAGAIAQWNEPQKMWKKAHAYKELGPLYSNDPILPVNVTDLHSELNTKSTGLSRRWTKTTLDNWFKTLDRCEDTYAPSRRALACQSMTRAFGEKFQRCAAFRTKELAKLSPLRTELERMSIELYGVDYGMTIGLMIGTDPAADVKWFDVVAVTVSFATRITRGNFYISP